MLDTMDTDPFTDLLPEPAPAPATLPLWLIEDAADCQMDAASFVSSYIEGALELCIESYRQQQADLYRRAARQYRTIALFDTPRTTSEAMTQAKIWSRALNLWRDGYKWEEVGANCISFDVYTPDHSRCYHVNLLRDTCTCDAIGKYGDCKHRLGVAVMFGEYLRTYARCEYNRYTGERLPIQETPPGDPMNFPAH